VRTPVEMDRYTVSEEQDQESQELIPIVQDTIIFNGKPLVVVRLPDGRPGVVLRWICENLHIQTQAQTDRIKRTEVIANDLVYVQVQTEGGFQRMPTLVLDSVPYWLATIDTRNMKKDDERRLEILAYQRRAVAALYAWAASQTATAAPTNIVPSEPITKPVTPAEDAPLEAWREYYQRMLALIDWQMDIEQWRGHVESRLEGVEAMTGLIPEILERLPLPTLTPTQQRVLQNYVQQLSRVTGKHSGTIYNELKEAFSVGSYKDIPLTEWSNVEHWFRVQIERAQRKK
jgi:P22_AR N-terminal domain